MNKVNKYIILVILASLMLLYNCKHISDYSNIPQITFNNSELTIGKDALDNECYKIQLHFYLIDGDGNVGLNHGIGEPYIGDSAYNYFSELYYLKNGIWVTDTLILDNTKHFILPDVTQYLGSNDLLKADVFIDYEYPTSLFPYDTIKYSIFVVDKDFNKSNTIFSDTIFTIR